MRLLSKKGPGSDSRTIAPNAVSPQTRECRPVSVGHWAIERSSQGFSGLDHLPRTLGGKRSAAAFEAGYSAQVPAVFLGLSGLLS